MKLNLVGLGKAIYFIYGFVCHQLPERSLFLFGPKWSYSISEIQAVWQKTENPLILRQFAGNPEMGWKVAWSDRMISLYGGVWVFGASWNVLNLGRRKISVWVLILLLLPMVLDGVTHFLSDLNGLSQGFRYTNAWLAELTQNSFAPSFYVGDGLGSFNSLMRWGTGFLFSLGLVWWIFPLLNEDSDSRQIANYSA